MRLLAFAIVAACAGPDVAPPTAPIAPPPTPEDAALVSPLVPDAAEPVVDSNPEVWLKGSTHVHAKPSGDSSEPIDDVMKWYADRGYDFIAITDHNRVSEVDGGDTRGNVAVHDGKPLIVLAGIELTHNPSGCLPQGHPSKRCRIHVNVLGVTERPTGKLEWAERKSHQRIDMYQAAIATAKALGGAIVQINHPQWYWGMTGDLLAELARRGAVLVEVANAQFMTWSAGDKDHPSMDQLWDDVLVQGLTMWGVASDDAHSYRGNPKDKWPAGGGWVVVKARRDPRAILDALAAGHFYASTGIVLAHADVQNNELVVDIATGETGSYTIAWIENGHMIATEAGRAWHRAIPATGYVRAIITRDDGARAWVQPVRGQSPT
jgi:hypothetical protein